MFGKTFQVVDVRDFCDAIEQHCDQVAREHGRIVITREGTDARCVLMSKAELDALERAVEILSGTNDALGMRSEVLRIAAQAEASKHVPASALS